MKVFIKKTLKKKAKGSILSLVVLMTLILSLVGVSLMGLGVNARLSAVRTTTQMSARMAADSGIIQAIHLMNEKLASGSITKGTELPSAPATYLPDSTANYTYTVTGDQESGYNIVSVGHSGQMQRTIKTGLKLKGLFDYAIFAAANIELKNGTTVSAYNMDGTNLPIQIGTNSTQDGAVNMKNGVTVEGDITIGPGGNTDTVIDSKMEAVITGETIASPLTWNMPEITVPQHLLDKASKGTLQGGETITEDGKYDAINITGINKAILIDGNVKIYVIGDVTIGNTCRLEILYDGDDNSGLILYLGGDLMAKKDSTINNQTKNSKALGIYALSTCTSMDFLNSGTFYGTIYAPNADVVIYNGMEMYGSVVANSFNQHVYGNFFYDGSLREVSIEDVGVRFVINRWQEE
jgi:hypothetical protein